jgi:ABC-type nitrate/sulfonate/bicarbonate transport system substrate-binding protein
MRRHVKSKMRTTAALIALAVTGFCVAGASAFAQQPTQEPRLTWGYFQGGVTSPGAVIASNATLASEIPAAMRAGSFDVVEGVGNPPVVSALAARTPLVVIFAESYDGAGLYVNTKVLHQVGDLAGQKIGDLVGSSEDYELQGYLQKNGLGDKAQVVPFASDAAAAAAYLAGTEIDIGCI